jgi:hypothetical protein
MCITFRRVRKIAKRNYSLHVCPSASLSAWNNSVPKGRIFIKFDIRVFFVNLSRNSQVSLKYDKNNGYFTSRPIYIFDLSPSIFLRTRNVSDKSCREIQDTRVKFSYISSENRVVYGVLWKNIVGPGRPLMTIWRMRTACWIPRATNTHLEYVILIAFPLQQWLHERVAMLRYTNNAVLFIVPPQFILCCNVTVTRIVKTT